MATLKERDELVIWHPFTQQKNRLPVIPIVRGKGSWLYTDEGTGLLDAISSWWVTLHGHAHPYIAEQLYQQALQLEQVIFAGFTHEPAVALAEQLLPLLPNDAKRVFYSDNGSTSTEVAIKMALQYWWNLTSADATNERNIILAFNNSYHGDTFGAMSVSDRSVFTLAFHEKLFDVLFIDTPTNDNIAATLDLIAEKGHQIAAFIYEPLVQGAGGLKMYPASLLNQLLYALQQQQIICIADEVMTGFGRTGQLFASQHLTYQPDIICLSKGLTGGTMALGITACNQRIYDAFVNDDTYKTFFHGHSFTANPLACTAALASLHLLLQPECLQQIAWITEQNQLFAKHIASHDGIKQVRTLGTILAFEIDKGKDEYLNNIGTRITQLGLTQQVYLRPLGNTVYIMPPYCCTPTEMQRIYQCLQTIIDYSAKGIF